MLTAHGAHGSLEVIDISMLTVLLTVALTVLTVHWKSLNLLCSRSAHGCPPNPPTTPYTLRGRLRAPRERKQTKAAANAEPAQWGEGRAMHLIAKSPAHAATHAAAKL
jgi:hypothetical protein